MAGFSITGQMKVSTLQNNFLEEFGLTLRVYDGRSFADPGQTLGQVRKKKGSGKALSVAKNMKVGNLEDKFEEEFGLKVQVAGSDDGYLCDNDLTLNAAFNESQEKIQKGKAKAESKVSNGETENTAQKTNSENAFDSGWVDVGVRAVNWYINTYRKTEDYDESLEMFDSEITEAMEASGIELEYSWSNDLSDGHIASIIEGVVKAASEYKDDDLIGALHTHINDRLFEAEEIHGQNTIAKWDERLSEML